jgi:hypothetical protein
VVDLWEAGEKVLVFGFYRETCGALRVHISQEIERRIMELAQHRLRAAGQDFSRAAVERRLERIQRRFFDDVRAAGRRALDDALNEVIRARASASGTAPLSADDGRPPSVLLILVLIMIGIVVDIDTMMGVAIVMVIMMEMVILIGMMNSCFALSR